MNEIIKCKVKGINDFLYKIKRELKFNKNNLMKSVLTK